MLHGGARCPATIRGRCRTVLGINDPWIVAAYLLCIASTLLCVVYGLINWNRGGETEKDQIKEEAGWEEDRKSVV